MIAQLCEKKAPKGQILKCSVHNNTANITEVKSSWGDYLASWDWEWFVSLTFRFLVSKKSADRKWNKWRKALELEIGEPIGFFRCSEVQMRREALHFHALMLNVDRLERYEYSNYVRAQRYYKKKKIDPTEEMLRSLAIRFYWNDKWYELAGIGRVLPYTKPASYYLSKYVTKELSDYKLGGCILKT